MRLITGAHVVVGITCVTILVEGTQQTAPIVPLLGWCVGFLLGRIHKAYEQDRPKQERETRYHTHHMQVELVRQKGDET